ncbi:hypothetical protein [Gluconobacter frateurii]|uniref:Head-tail adaptor protein n=1 Tax=Gluconobacter frateurii NRIC 0228 TaxID=1307946 RepID=A0ABQ0QFR7_9PROT|nr:hypothetical protein [Gluconobacter frateurii]GBR17530.1 hypothetical protein AA0228_3049 [Gluconobacter frateurii NRIC 0228]GLP91999.1 hypothetical protein GCM10007868_30740 [Gluconobacter frateurii]
MLNKFQQKLHFTKQEFDYDNDLGANIQQEVILFSEWADVQNVSEQAELNGVQLVELGYSHTAKTRWISGVSSKMKCHRNLRQPDRSILKQSFIVTAYEPIGQDNKYMLLKLSQVVAS